MPDWLNKRVWQFDPFPTLPNYVLSFQGRNVERSIYSPDRNKLLRYLENEAISLTEKNGINLDFENLTPHQAIDIVFSLLRSRMNYEDLIAGPSPDDIESLRNGTAKTSAPELVSLFKENHKAFTKRSAELKEKINRMTTDQRLEFGFGVCRHFAADASVLFECLKQVQRGLLLNGSYLLCHSDHTSPYRSINHHSYNVFLATRPGKHGINHCFLTVLDPTISLVNTDYDVTWTRLAQALGFLIKFGDKINIDNSKDIATVLADKAVGRVSGYLESVSSQAVLGGDISSIICDYAALLALSSFRTKKMVLARIRQTITMFDRSPEEALIMALIMPLFFRKTIHDDWYFESVWSEEVLKEVSEVDFSAIGDEESETLANLVTVAVKSIARYDKKPDKASLDLCYFFVNYCILNSVSIMPKLRKDLIDFLVKYCREKNIDNTKLIAEFRALRDLV
ncbi:hypothetical protein HYU90_01020 [Candidatus Collierbacteria bacterium]|nr:hypothetical protein [Candidatus Collierbacteria bacterium]